MVAVISRWKWLKSESSFDLCVIRNYCFISLHSKDLKRVEMDIKMLLQ